MSRRPVRARPTGVTPLQPAPAQLLVGDQRAPEQPTTGVTESQTSGVTDSQSSAVTKSRPPEVDASPEPADRPRYLRMVRKEARVRHDQADALARLRRRISADRVDRSEPLTDNTLIRVALDVLLLHADALSGDTEEQLRDSLTARLRNSGTL